MNQAVWFGILMLLQLSAQDAGLSSALSQSLSDSSSDRQTFELDVYINSTLQYSGSIRGTAANGAIRGEEGLLGRYESSSNFRQVYLVFPSMNLPTAGETPGISTGNGMTQRDSAPRAPSGPYAHGSMAPLLFDLTPALAGRSLSPGSNGISIPRGYSVPADLGEESSPMPSREREDVPEDNKSENTGQEDNESDDAGREDNEPEDTGQDVPDPSWILRRGAERLSASNPSLGVLVILNLPR